jgi:hypothetical protein
MDVVDGVAAFREAAQQPAQLQRAAARVAGRVGRVFETHRLGGLLVGLASLDPSSISAAEAVGGPVEAVPRDEPDGAAGPAVGTGRQAVKRHDARMLEPAGDFYLDQEPMAADRIVAVVVEHLVERHLAV